MPPLCGGVGGMVVIGGGLLGAGVAAVPEKADEKRYDPNDLEVPSFLRRR